MVGGVGRNVILAMHTRGINVRGEGCDQRFDSTIFCAKSHAFFSVVSSRRLDVLHAPVLLRRTAVHLLRLVCEVRILDLLRARSCRESILDAAGDDVVLEQDVDRLERHTLGLRHTEDSVEAHDDTARSEQQEGA